MVSIDGKKLGKPLDNIDIRVSRKVLLERLRQYAKWGDQKHIDKQWWWILQEELAEAKCKIELDCGDTEVINELIQCSAVIQAWIRDIMRV